MTNISRADPVETSHTTLVYYMIEGNTAGAITAADRTAGLMQLFSDQELAIKFGYEVVVKAEGMVKGSGGKRCVNSEFVCVCVCVFVHECFGESVNEYIDILICFTRSERIS